MSSAVPTTPSGPRIGPGVPRRGERLVAGGDALVQVVVVRHVVRHEHDELPGTGAPADGGAVRRLPQAAPVGLGRVAAAGGGQVVDRALDDAGVGGQRLVERPRLVALVAVYTRVVLDLSDTEVHVGKLCADAAHEVVDLTLRLGQRGVHAPGRVEHDQDVGLRRRRGLCGNGDEQERAEQQDQGSERTRCHRSPPTATTSPRLQLSIGARRARGAACRTRTCARIPPAAARCTRLAGAILGMHHP